jgi:hypothetical protein
MMRVHLAIKRPNLHICLSSGPPECLTGLFEVFKWLLRRVQVGRGVCAAILAMRGASKAGEQLCLPKNALSLSLVRRHRL